MTQYAELTGPCKILGLTDVTPAAVQIRVWESLCEARILSHAIVVNDFLRATGSPANTQVNLEALRKLSRQLEDGVVRELLGKALAFNAGTENICSISEEDQQRVREMFKEIYLLDKPNKTFESEIESHKTDLGNHMDVEHALAFVGLADALGKIGTSCKEQNK